MYWCSSKPATKSQLSTSYINALSTKMQTIFFEDFTTSKHMNATNSDDHLPKRETVTFQHHTNATDDSNPC